MQVFREVKFFGDSEIAALRSDLQNHKQQLEALKAARAERARREEQLVGAGLGRRGAGKAVEQRQFMQVMHHCSPVDACCSLAVHASAQAACNAVQRLSLLEGTTPLHC